MLSTVITIIAWILSFSLLLLGAYVTVMNWAVFVNNVILKKPCGSAIPFGGGLFGSLGIIIMPIKDSFVWCWIPCFVDWGSFPAVIVSLTYVIKEKLKKKKKAGEN